MNRVMKRMILMTLLITLSISSIFMLNNVKEQRLEAMIKQAQIDASIPFELDIDKLSSNYIFVVNPANNEVLFSHQAQEKIYPASLTKLMSALVSVELYSNLNETIEVPNDIFHELYKANAALAGFEAEESVTVYDLLHGMLIPSGADATLTLVLNAVENEETFAKIMNKKAHDLGMKSTQFKNATGLHDPQQYSSTYDIMILLQEVINNKELKRILSKQEYYTDANDIHPDGIKMKSTIFDAVDDIKYLQGGKTGFTLEAGQCLASFGTVNNEEFLVVTAQADTDSFNNPNHIIDHMYIYQAIDEYMELLYNNEVKK